MGIRILCLRHRLTPRVDGCRWCGFPELDHYGFMKPTSRFPGVDNADTPAHGYTPPTDEQRAARRAAPLFFTMPDSSEVANGARTRL